MARICTNCGKEIPDGAAFCTECGTAAANAAIPPKAQEPPKPSYTPPVQPIYAQPPVQPVYAPYPYQAPAPSGDAPPPDGSKYAAISGKGYLGIMLLMCIPILGLILTVIWACGGCKKLNKRNMARASLTMLAILIVLLLVLFLTAKPLIGKFTDTIKQQSGITSTQQDNDKKQEGGLSGLLGLLGGSEDGSGTSINIGGLPGLLGGEGDSDISESDMRALEGLLGEDGKLNLESLGGLLGENGKLNLEGLEGLLGEDSMNKLIEDAQGSGGEHGYTGKDGAALKSVDEKSFSAVVKEVYGLELSEADGWTVTKVESINGINDLGITAKLKDADTAKAMMQLYFERCLSVGKVFKENINWDTFKISRGERFESFDEFCAAEDIGESTASAFGSWIYDNGDKGVQFTFYASDGEMDINLVLLG